MSLASFEPDLNSASAYHDHVTTGNSSSSSSRSTRRKNDLSHYTPNPTSSPHSTTFLMINTTNIAGIDGSRNSQNLTSSTMNSILPKSKSKSTVPTTTTTNVVFPGQILTPVYKSSSGRILTEPLQPRDDDDDDDDDNDHDDDDGENDSVGGDEHRNSTNSRHCNLNTEQTSTLPSSSSSPSSSASSALSVSTSTSRSYIHSSFRRRLQRLFPPYVFVLPVLLLEFLALALTRAVLPGMLLQVYDSKVYIVLGCADCIRGILAFIACPIFGQWSDKVGRQPCLLITVLGTCAPVCSLAFFAWPASSTIITTEDNNITGVSTSLTSSLEVAPSLPPMAIPLFVALLSLSGIFSSTFTLVFAYVSDTVSDKQERLSAYGVALATLGLSFTIGPMVGGYLAEINPLYVFQTSLGLTIIDLLYIAFILPESKPKTNDNVGSINGRYRGNSFIPSSTTSVADSIGTSTKQQQFLEAMASSIATVFHQANIFSSSFYGRQRRKTQRIPTSFDQQYSQQQQQFGGGETTSSYVSSIFDWKKPFQSLEILKQDPFLRHVGWIAFLYYTGVWAVFSTLSLYAVQQFHLTTERLGELMSALGLSTMIAEAILVRVLVPKWGEAKAIRYGLVSFALQCFILGYAYESWHLFVCVAFSLLGNLVYPSLSSLVTTTVEPSQIGQALGAMNGVRALTEGIGPLFFGTFMTISEKYTPHFPGWPYWIAGCLVLGAYEVATRTLPLYDGDNYIHELEFKRRRRPRPSRVERSGGERTTLRNGSSDIHFHDDQEQSMKLKKTDIEGADIGDIDCMDMISNTATHVASAMMTSTDIPMRDEEDEEYQGLLSLLQLSEVEESEDNDDDDENDESIGSDNRDDNQMGFAIAPT